MKTLRRLLFAFIPLFTSSVITLAWQHRNPPKGIVPIGGAPVQERFSNAWTLRSSATSASPPHARQGPGDLNMSCCPKGGNTESSAKGIGGLNLLHEDDAVIALDKPAGIPVFPPPSTSASQKPTPTNTDSVIERVLAHYKAISDSVPIPETLRGLYEAPGGRQPLESGTGDPTESEETPGVDAVVHRLDRGTSGVLLLAKTAASASSLRQQFRERRVKKIYFAVTQGRLKGPITVTSCIGRAPNDRRKMQSARQIWGVHGAATQVPSGKLRGAVTLFKPLLFNGRWSVVLASPVTGRTHQIRLHLQMLKTPIIGDPLYGDACATSGFLASAVALRSKPLAGSFGSPSGACVGHGGPIKALGREHLRPLLHAAEVCCVHPTTAEKLQVRAPLPPDMLEAIGVVDPLWSAVPELTPFAGGLQ